MPEVSAARAAPDPASAGTLLAVRDLQAWYGESHVLHGVDLDVRAGEIVTLLGRNGAGKTTTLKAIIGMVPARRGSVRLEGRELIGLPSHQIARLGIALCPEEPGIVASGMGRCGSQIRSVASQPAVMKVLPRKQEPNTLWPVMSACCRSPEPSVAKAAIR